MEVVIIVVALVSAYLLGSLPSAYIAGRLVKGVDIRRVGGGNVGAANTMREVGILAGFAVLLADVGKGALAVLIANWLGLEQIWVFAAGFLAVAGHMFPVWLRFRGGQGAATTMGVLLAVVPLAFAISFALMAITVLITSNVRLGAVAGLAPLPLIIWLLGGELSLIIYAIVMAVFTGLKSLRRVRTDLAQPGSRKNFFIDRDYKPWQTKR